MLAEELDKGFEEIRAGLKAFILRITASVQDTEDIVQDTYLKAHEKIESFRAESSLKTWLFSIASNLAKDNLRAQKRWTENVTDICKEEAQNNPQFFHEAMQIQASSPQGLFELKEHITFCFTCISKSLPLEQQICLLLKEVHAFKVLEISEIAGLSEAMVKYYLHTARSRMIGIFEGRCSIINKEGICHQCSELNGIFNPKQKMQEELVKIDMARQAGKADREKLFDLRMQIIQATDPFLSKAAELQLHHLEHNRKVMEKFSSTDE